MAKKFPLLRIFDNLFYPKRCVFCRRPLPLHSGMGYCNECMKVLPFCLALNRCKHCGRPVSGEEQLCSHCRNREPKFFRRISAAYLYKGIVRRSLLRFKRERYRNHGLVYAQHMALTLKEDVPNEVFDLVVAVPPRGARMKEQDYDQAMTLGKQLAKQLRLPFRNGVLFRTEPRRKQSRLSSGERLQNIHGNIHVRRKGTVSSKRILLVDDICTTGSTLNECARVLGNAGAKAVFCAVAAIAPEE